MTLVEKDLEFFSDQLCRKVVALVHARQRSDLAVLVQTEAFSKEDKADIRVTILKRDQLSKETSMYLYRAQEGFVNLDCARKRQIDLTEPRHSRIGKGGEEDRFGKLAASLNSQNLIERGISDYFLNLSGLVKGTRSWLNSCFPSSISLRHSSRKMK